LDWPDPNPKYFIPDPNPDPAKSSGFDRIRIHNTGQNAAISRFTCENVEGDHVNLGVAVLSSL
jgi:hypothetical protein